MTFASSSQIPCMLLYLYCTQPTHERTCLALQKPWTHVMGREGIAWPQFRYAKRSQFCLHRWWWRRRGPENGPWRALVSCMLWDPQMMIAPSMNYSNTQHQDGCTDGIEEVFSFDLEKVAEAGNHHCYHELQFQDFTSWTYLKYFEMWWLHVCHPMSSHVPNGK